MVILVSKTNLGAEAVILLDFYVHYVSRYSFCNLVFLVLPSDLVYSGIDGVNVAEKIENGKKT